MELKELRELEGSEMDPEERKKVQKAFKVLARYTRKNLKVRSVRKI